MATPIPEVSSLNTEILELDLEPSPRQQGVLRSLDASQRVALSKRGSPFHWEVRIINEAHGKVKRKNSSEEETASLFLINAKILQTHPERRIKNARIEFIFRKKVDPPEPVKNPNIIKIALADEVPLFLNYSLEVQSNTTKTGVEAKVDAAGYGGVGANWEKEHKAQKMQPFSTKVTGILESEGDDQDDPTNIAKWICVENRSDHSGVPPSLAMGILLIREPGPIELMVNVKVEIDWRQSVKDWMSSFPFWEKKLKWITIDPTKPRTGLPENVEPEHLELLGENKLLESLCHIRMPEEYRPPNSTPNPARQGPEVLRDNATVALAGTAGDEEREQEEEQEQEEKVEVEVEVEAET